MCGLPQGAIRYYKGLTLPSLVLTVPWNALLSNFLTDPNLLQGPVEMHRLIYFFSRSSKDIFI